MVNAPISLRRFGLAPIAVAVRGGLRARCPGAGGRPRSLRRRRGRSNRPRGFRSTIPHAQAEPSLDDVHTAVAAYLLVPRRYPASAYSDDALWKAGHLSLDAFARFGRTGDRDAGQRLLKRLATGYPGSKLAKQVPAALAGATPAAAAVPPPATEPPPLQLRSRRRPPRPLRPLRRSRRRRRARKPATARATGSTATIRSIRRTVLPDAVRIIIELDGEVAFQRGAHRRVPTACSSTSRRRVRPRRSRTRRSASTAIRTSSARCVSAATRIARRASCSMPAAWARTACTRSTTPTGSSSIACARGARAAPPPLLAAKRLSPAWGRQLPSAAPVNAVALRKRRSCPGSRRAAADVAPAPAAAARSRCCCRRPGRCPDCWTALPGPPTRRLDGLAWHPAAVIVRAPSPAPKPPLRSRRSCPDPGRTVEPKPLAALPRGALRRFARPWRRCRRRPTRRLRSAPERFRRRSCRQRALGRGGVDSAAGRQELRTPERTRTAAFPSRVSSASACRGS